MQHDRFTFNSGPQLSTMIYTKDGGMKPAQNVLIRPKSLIKKKNTNICPDDHSFIQPPLPW
jgi:hypothetical protein